MRPYLTIGNRAPDWAVRKRTPSPRDGICKPSSKEFRLFAQAAGRHFDGTVDGVPRVSLWAIWNEPNLKSWLAPQRSSKGVPLAPSIYRELYIAGAQGPRRDGPWLRHDPPRRADAAGGRVPHEVHAARLPARDGLPGPPLPPVPRRRREGSQLPEGGRIATSGIALHPYTSRAGLSSRPKPGETPINALSRLTHQLDLLARRGKLPRRLPVWLTEYGFQTNPPDPYQLSIKKAPAQMDQSEWIAFRNRRVRSYSQYTLVDEGLNPGGGFQRYARFQMGLRFSDGRIKTGVYDAFRMPAFVRVLSSRRVEVFGGLRTRAGAVAQIESRRRTGSYRPLAQARLNSAGYFRRVLSASGVASRTYRITIDGRSRVKKPVRP